MVNLKWWFHLAYPAYFGSLLLLAAIEIPGLGYTAMGATRWLDLGVTRIQPSELMKIALVLALARWYHGATAQEARFHWKLIYPALMIGAPFALVAHQPDLGSALLLGMTGAAIMFAAGLSWKIIVAAGGAVIAGVWPSGGLLGKGYGLGSQSQLEFLPERHTDFIFAAVSEEFGFVGSFGMLLCYLGVSLLSLRIASLSHSHFGRLATAGVTATFALYVLINGAMVMGLAPVVGVPMPLMSNGGTVMLTVMIGFGLVMATRVHRYVELPKGHGLF